MSQVAKKPITHNKIHTWKNNNLSVWHEQSQRKSSEYKQVSVTDFIYLNVQLQVYTKATSRCRIQLELETSLGKVLIKENSYSIFEVNNDG